MVHPDGELRYINDDIGYGVVATRLIPRGSITWVLDDLDQIFTPDRVEKLPEFLQPFFEKYSFIDGDGRSILCWDHARFINHSCEPTCLNTGFNFEIAGRDIHPGEQLTDDYGTLNLGEDFACCCRSPLCRQVVKPNDFLKYVADWDRLIQEVFPLIARVDQPLWPLVKEKHEVDLALKGCAPIPSCFVHYAKI